MKLDEVLDVRQYMQKIAFDFLIQNGDYTDEVYLYDEPGDNKIQLKVLPWDLDDIFAEQPHEIGNSWGPGQLFGYREYNSIQDIIDDVGEKLIYSIEDDLDYKIAKDPFLYSVYLEELEKLLVQLTAADISQEFSNIESELTSFFEREDIVEQTSYDLESCSLEKLKEQLNNKENLLITRRQTILDQL